MSISDVTIHPAEWVKSKDGRTGNEVWQITSHAATSEAIYFEGQAFTADERYLIVRSARSGQSELFRCDLSTGQLVQLTENCGESGHSFNMHPDGRHVYWIGHDALWRVDVQAAGAAEQVWCNRGAYPGELWPFPVSFASDGRRVALSVKDRSRQTNIANSFTGEKSNPSHMIVLELDTLEHQLVLSHEWGFSHPMICPSDRDLISFVLNGAHCWNMDLPDEQRVRTWIVRVGEGVAKPFIIPKKYRTITHESWSPDGHRMYFFDKTWREWTPAIIGSVNREGGDWQAHYTDYTRNLGHGRCSSDGRWFIADCQKKHDSPLILVDLHTGAHEILCWPDASNDAGHKASAHVHPSFSSQGNYITYTSDRTGSPQVYVVPLRS